MNLSHALYAIRWMIRDTFRQAWASGIFWMMLGVSGLCVVFCLSVGVVGGQSLQRVDEPPEFLPRGDRQADPETARAAGVDVVGGDLTLAFGTIRLSLGRDAADAVHFLQLLLAGGVADAGGLLLALVWTAGFLPGFLQPSAAAVLLTKPVPRWGLLVGKYLGVLAFVGFQATVFVGGTWLALAVRTGVWDAAYLLCIPLLLLHFAIFYSVSALIAVCTRSTVACVFGSVLFWLLCWGMNYGRHAVLATPELESASPALLTLTEAGYWLLPKPVDFGILLFDALEASNCFGPLPELQAMQTKGALLPELAMLTSLLFAFAMLALAGRQFATTDY